MRSTTKLALSALALGLLSTAGAEAGARKDYPVVVDPFARSATGSMGSAIAIGTYIGCWTGVTGLNDSQGGDTMFHAGCWAKDALGREISCTFPDTHAYTTQLPALRVTSRDARISFNWTVSGLTNVCTQVQTWVYASLKPKV
jgi:hypothetical protein